MRGIVLGVPSTIVVDDVIPFLYGNPAYAKINPYGASFAPFIEKAYSKLNGNYEFIQGGFLPEVARFVAGVPADVFYPSQSNPVADWQRIANADTDNWVMLAGSVSVNGGTDSTYTVIGLPQSHAYSLLGAYNVTYANGTSAALLLKLRNPWGYDSAYNGTWNDNSAIWLDTVNNFAGQVNHVADANDGVFFIDIASFATNYSEYSIAYYYDNYWSSVQPVYGSQNNIYQRFDFVVPTTQDGFIGVDFYNQRMYPQQCNKATVNGRIVIYLNGQKLSNNSISDTNPYAFVHQTWAAGSYSVLVSVAWGPVDVPDYSFRLYFPQTIQIGTQQYSTSAAAVASIGTPITIPASGTQTYITTQPATPPTTSSVSVPAPQWPLIIPSAPTPDFNTGLAKAWTIVSNGNYNVGKGWVTQAAGGNGYFASLSAPPSGQTHVYVSTQVAPSTKVTGTPSIVWTGFDYCYQADNGSSGIFTFICGGTLDSSNPSKTLNLLATNVGTLWGPTVTAQSF